MNELEEEAEDGGGQGGEFTSDFFCLGLFFIFLAGLSCRYIRPQSDF